MQYVQRAGLGSYLLGCATLGLLWPNRTRFKSVEPEQVSLPASITKPEQESKTIEELLSENSIYGYFTHSIKEFGRHKPTVDVVLRSAATNGAFIKHNSLDRVKFEDPNTHHTLTLNLRGNIIALNNNGTEINI